MENLDSFEIGAWNLAGKNSSDTPTSTSKIGEVINQYNNNKIILRIFKKPEIWKDQLKKLIMS